MFIKMLLVFAALFHALVLLYALPRRQGPSKEEVRSAIEFFNWQKNESPVGWSTAVRQVETLARGEDPENIRRLYPHWRNEDFARLARCLS